jgi:hypothetical protein
VPANLGNNFRLYVEATPGIVNSAIGSYASGFAIANSGTATATVTLDLFSNAGVAVGSTSIQVPGSGVYAKFIDELFPSVPLPFQGVVRISSSTSALSVVGLRIRWNERSEFLMTTTPPANEDASTTTDEFDFPHILNGGGFTTEFILFSGSGGQTSSGNLKFSNPDGSALNLNVQ